MASTTYARLEWSPERDLPSYRGVTADELEATAPREGFRVFVRDLPGMEAGEVSGPAVAFLKKSVRILAHYRAFDYVHVSSKTGAASISFFTWNEAFPERVTLLRNIDEVRDFLAHYDEREGTLLIAVALGGSRSLLTPQTHFESFVRAVGPPDRYESSTFIQESPEGAARRRSLELRDELLALGWPTSAEVARYFGSKAGNAAQIAAKKRAEGKLFGVWSVADNTFVHPDFQFDAHQQVRPELPTLLAALNELPGMSGEDDPGGWRRTFWLYGATPRLSEVAVGDGMSDEPRSSAEVFARSPQAVIDFARSEAARDPNADW